MIRTTLLLPSISNGDSLDWKDPTPGEITKKVVGNVTSGSIVLFHNDLANTTEALPQVLEQLSQRGFGFVPVSELIYQDGYKVDSNGMQIPDVQSSIDISPDNIDEVMAQYSDRLKGAGITDEQLAMAAQAVKSGADIPDGVYEAIAEVLAPQTAAEDSAPQQDAAPAAENMPEK